MALINYDSTGVEVLDPSPTGDGGKAINDNFKLLAYYRRAIPKHVNVVGVVIPAIAANTRYVLTLNVGQLKNPNLAIVGFFTSATADADIQNLVFSSNNGVDRVLKNSVRIAPNVDPTDARLIITPILNPAATQRMMIVTRNYQDATRCAPSFGENYHGFSSGFSCSYSYAAMNIGVLFGYYILTGIGVLQLNKKIEMESAWLSDSGTDSILNIAFYNRDTAANTALSLKVGVYE